MRYLRTIPALIVLWAFSAQAQVRSDRSIQLDGLAPESRAVQGLKNATSGADAMNARTLLSGGYTYAEVSGDNWQADVEPALAQPITGTRLLLQAANGNAGAVTLSVNGSPAYAVVKAGNAPLVTGDVVPGAAVSVVFDGTSFQLISARRLERKPCPSGTVQVGELYCIDAEQRPALDFPNATVACGAAGMKLCGWGQYFVACMNAAELGIAGMSGDWEWTDDGANSDGEVRVMGPANCWQQSVSPGWDVPGLGFHCCFKR